MTKMIEDYDAFLSGHPTSTRKEEAPELAQLHRDLGFE